MPVDLVVCAHNEAESVARTLLACERAENLGKLIVVVDASSDATLALARRFTWNIVEGSWADKGSAMAAGLQQVTTPLVAFCDSDLRGLLPGHVTGLLTLPPEEGQVVAIPHSDTAPRHLPSLSGERRLPTGTARRAGLPGAGWKAETRLNAQVAREGLPWHHYVMRGVTNPPGWHPESYLQWPLAVAASAPELLAYTAHPDGSLPRTPITV